MGKRILQLTEAELAEIQASGFLPVSVPSETFRLAINHLLANWKPWATEPTKGSLEISTTQYPATIPVKIGGTICGYLVPAPPTNETGVVLSWVDEETGFAWREEVISSTQIKDNAYDSDENPANPDNITDIKQLTFFRDVGRDLKQTLVISEERVYGVLIPPPSSEADIGKVPMLNNLGQIVWETVPNEESIDYQISSAVQNLQTELTFDTTPTADSTNPVTSGGIKTSLNAKQDAFTIIDEDASIAGSTATVSIEQGDLCIVDLSEETSLTAIEIVLTNNSEVAFPLWWFKIESGSAVTLSVKIGSVAVGWLGSAIANIAIGKTIEVSVVDGVACGGELV